MKLNFKIEPSKFLKDIRYLTRWGFGLSMGMILMLHFLKPGFNSFTRHISEYANGKFGVFMILAWLFFAFGLLGLAFQSYRIISGVKFKISFSFLFILCAFSAIVLGLFTIPPLGTPSNTSSIIHHQTMPIFLVSVMAGMTLFCIRLRTETELKHMFRTSAILAALVWVSFFFLLWIGRNAEFQGLIQRIFIVFLWLWHMFISWKLT